MDTLLNQTDWVLFVKQDKSSPINSTHCTIYTQKMAVVSWPQILWRHFTLCIGLIHQCLLHKSRCRTACTFGVLTYLLNYLPGFDIGNELYWLVTANRIRDDHGDGIPSGNHTAYINKTPTWGSEWEGAEINVDWNGNDSYFRTNFYCCRLVLNCCAISP